MLIYSLVWTLIGCAEENSCKTYVEAAATCATGAGGDPSPYDAAIICGDWLEADEAKFGEWYRCRTAAIEAGDCTTADGLDAALADAESCPQP